MLNVKDNVASATARRARRSRVILHDPPMQKGALKAPFCYAQNLCLMALRLSGLQRCTRSGRIRRQSATRRPDKALAPPSGIIKRNCCDFCQPIGYLV
ncbi:hypothetical protein CKO_02391 [Citrobacter koseri ATCC BAA-895]|uniref:Uncharacterized protein n=1 Tax=Citrobacter koseri (strain ATCC BAA-895 / CDC 4225-83 / SGSC4696) TaxID=290338 RepID=A8AJ50_CITK8|nr:hypothetical protein CKO_02391 [Citrobacter koseri ATCC BAA-895]